MKVERVAEHFLEATFEAKETKAKVVLRHTYRRSRRV